MTSEILYLILFATVIISGSVVLFLKIEGNTLKLILSFSGAYLLSIAVLHLIPEIYSADSEHLQSPNTVHTDKNCRHIHSFRFPSADPY